MVRTWVAVLVLGVSGAAAAHGPLFLADRPECRELDRYARKDGHSPLDGLVITKGGEIQYETYGKKWGPDQPHALWSVTKTITGALLGIAVRDGRISLDQRLSEFYPRGQADAAYDSIRISDLFYMDTGLKWNESINDAGQSALLSMLFGPYRADMAAFVASRPEAPQGGGYKWQYNSGNHALAMGVLRQVYGQDYITFPWRDLFGPLGMDRMVFERDLAGTFIGGAYGFATPRDMAKFGNLYLNRGVMNGQTILPDGWIEKTLTPSPGYMTDALTEQQISDGGNLLYGGSVWLNREPRPGMHRPFPASPDDMIMALGKDGQMIDVIPSHDIVIARTGRGGEYDSALDGLVTRTLACLEGSSDPVAPVAPGFLVTKPLSLKTDIEVLKTGLRTGLLQGAVAKWTCTCHFVSGLDIGDCVRRTNVPLASTFTHTKIHGDQVEVRPSGLGKIIAGSSLTATAVFDSRNPQFGCTLQ
ncbi:MAG TPA: serine hydrolase [Bdellovibrionota bacterium]|nr:serine hydrolase [Bdellovibrionota bacterium]